MKIAILGATGRMGRMLLREVLDTDGAELCGAVDRNEVGTDVGSLIARDAVGVTVTDKTEDVIKDADAVIDFTCPEASVWHAGMAARHGTVHVIGTTGLSKEQEAKLDEAAKDTAIIYASNMSVGVNLLFALTEQVARRLGVEFDIEIFEAHHKHKVDSPSGTALSLGQYAAKGRGVDLDDVKSIDRTGARKEGDIGFAVYRGGDVIGEHTVSFLSEGERIELTHKASDRAIFARGAVRAALWGGDKTPGLYSMFDVLDLKI